jgi:putative tricarboxylic transport membrane protein
VVVGMILGPLAEAQLRNAMSIGEGSAAVFFQRPMSIALVIVVLAVLILPRIAKRMSERKLAAAAAA